MNKRDLTFLGAGVLAGRAMKKKTAPGIGAMSKHWKYVLVVPPGRGKRAMDAFNDDRYLRMRGYQETTTSYLFSSKKDAKMLKESMVTEYGVPAIEITIIKI